MNKIRRAIALLLSVVMILGMLPMNALAETVKRKGTGYTEDNSASTLKNIYIMDEAGESYIAYCYSYNIPYPSNQNVGGTSYFSLEGYQNADAESFYNLAIKTNPNSKYDPKYTSPEELKLRIMNVLYAGYPYNQSGNDLMKEIQKRYFYTDPVKIKDRFYAATQMAIYHYTDFEYYDNQTVDGIAKMIVDYAEKATEIPEGMELDLWVPENSFSQNLLVSRIKKGEMYEPPVPEVQNDEEIKTRVVVRAKKTMDGNIPQDGAFEFILKDENRKEISRTTNVGQDVIFEPVLIDEAGEYTFYIQEVAGSDAAIIYDTNEYPVTVNVSEDDFIINTNDAEYYGISPSDDVFTIQRGSDGKEFSAYCLNHDREAPRSSFSENFKYKQLINPSAEEIKNCFTINNSYYDSGAYPFDLNKIDENLKKLFYYFETDGRDIDQELRAYYVWSLCGNGDFWRNGIHTGNEVRNILNTVNVPAGYTLLIYVPENEQVRDKYGYMIKPQPLGRGVYSCEVAEIPEIKNITKPQEKEIIKAQAVVQAKKTLDGNTPQDGAFEFVLKDENKNEISRTKNVGQDVIFDAVTFDEAGEYTFYIQEVAGSDAAIIYDTNEYPVTVSVSEDDFIEILDGCEYYGSSPAYDEIKIQTRKDGNEMTAYCLNHSVQAPNKAISEEFKYYQLINPSSETIKKYLTINNSYYDSGAYPFDLNKIDENLKKLFYYFETDGSDIDQELRAYYVWSLCGNGDFWRDGIHTGNEVRNILNTVNVPAEYTLLIYVPENEQVRDQYGEMIKPQPLGRGVTKVKKIDMVPEIKNITATNVKVLFSKTNIAGEEIEGAQIEIRNENGNILKGTLNGTEDTDLSYTSNGQETMIEMLPGTYVFHEEAAPNGYKIVNDITFTVDENGNISITDYNGNSTENILTEDNRLIVVDEYDDVEPEEPEEPKETENTVKKVDQYGNFVIGAKLRITNRVQSTASASNASKASPSNASGAKTSTILNSNSIRIAISRVINDIISSDDEDDTIELINDQRTDVNIEWTTEKNAHTFELSEGEYILEEVEVPEGYEKAAAIEFTVDADGNLIVNGEIKEEIIMVDTKIENTTVEEPKNEEPKNEEPKNEEPKNETPKNEEAKEETPSGGTSSGGGGSSSGGGSSTGGHSSKGSNTSGGPGVLVKSIENNETPLANIQGQDTETLVTLDQDVPLAMLPKTGDNTKDFIWIMLGISSFAILSGMYTLNKKKYN